MGTRKPKGSTSCYLVQCRTFRRIDQRGTAIGAAIGGATGAVVAGKGQEHLKLPAETRLQFNLGAAVTGRR